MPWVMWASLNETFDKSLHWLFHNHGTFSYGLNSCYDLERISKLFPRINGMSVFNLKNFINEFLSGGLDC